MKKPKNFPVRKAQSSRRCFNPKSISIPAVSVSDPMTVAKVFEDLVFSSHKTAALAENFIVLILNARNDLLNVYRIEGTVDHAAVYPREAIIATYTSGGACVVLAHNHPSGNIEPSAQDIALTRRLKEAFKTVDIAVHDHIIVAHDFEGNLMWSSMRELGLMP